jgi:DNA methylase
MPEPAREIVCAEALAWMDATPAPARQPSKLPDVSELPALGFEGWRAWFVGAARRVIRWVPDDGVAIFFQSDVLHRGAWIDKGYLVMRAADDEGASLVWHAIACRTPPGTPTQGRASYSHMLCVAKAPRPPKHGRPHVLSHVGAKSWSKAMGIEACRYACGYLIDETDTRTVVDPFCGEGTVLAVANAMGLDAIGVDVSRARCKVARSMRA